MSKSQRKSYSITLLDDMDKLDKTVCTCPCSTKSFANFRSHSVSIKHQEFMKFGLHWKVPIHDGLLFHDEFKEGCLEMFSEADSTAEDTIYPEFGDHDKLWFIDEEGLVYGVATFISLEEGHLRFSSSYWIKHIGMKIAPITKISLYICSDLIHIKKREIEGLHKEYENIRTYIERS